MSCMSVGTSKMDKCEATAAVSRLLRKKSDVSDNGGGGYMTGAKTEVAVMEVTQCFGFPEPFSMISAPGQSRHIRHTISDYSPVGI